MPDNTRAMPPIQDQARPPQRDTRSVALVGRRNGALRAAKALGLDYRILGTSDDADDTTAAVPDAVVALTEAAVLPAARLRERWHLAGLDVAAATRCTDKLAMKEAVAAAGLPCAQYLPVSGRLDGPALAARLGLPLVIKKRRGSGGRDARIVRSLEEMPARVDVECLAESFVAGVEMSVESFVSDGEPVFTNLTDYVEPRWANIAPARLAPDVRAAVLETHRRAIAALGVGRGLTHMEVFLTPGGVVFGELAARPPGGHIMRLIELAYGFDPWRALLEIELGGLPDLPAAAQRSAGVRFIYPDAGVIRSVDGLDRVRGLATAVDVVCKLQPGERIEARQSTGQHRGFAIFAGGADAVRSDLDRAGDLLEVVVDGAS